MARSPSLSRTRSRSDGWNAVYRSAITPNAKVSSSAMAVKSVRVIAGQYGLSKVCRRRSPAQTSSAGRPARAIARRAGSRCRAADHKARRLPRICRARHRDRQEHERSSGPRALHQRGARDGGLYRQDGRALGRQARDRNRRAPADDSGAGQTHRRRAAKPCAAGSRRPLNSSPDEDCTKGRERPFLPAPPSLVSRSLRRRPAADSRSAAAISSCRER